MENTATAGKTPGFLLFFAKRTENTPVRGQIIAIVTDDPHYHVETVFAWRQDIAKPRYTIGDTPYRFTALVGHPFSRHEIPENYLNNGEKLFDVLFVPIPDTAARDKAVAWARKENGVPYNFLGAVMSPFKSFTAAESQNNPDEIQTSLFCSQAVTIMMQLSRALGGFFEYVVAENITPAELYTILHGKSGVDTVALEQIAFAPNFPFQAPKKRNTGG